MQWSKKDQNGPEDTETLFCCTIMLSSHAAKLVKDTIKALGREVLPLNLALSDYLCFHPWDTHWLSSKIPTKKSKSGSPNDLRQKMTSFIVVVFTIWMVFKKYRKQWPLLWIKCFLHSRVKIVFYLKKTL